MVTKGSPTLKLVLVKTNNVITKIISEGKEVFKYGMKIEGDGRIECSSMGIEMRMIFSFGGGLPIPTLNRVDVFYRQFWIHDLRNTWFVVCMNV